MTTFKISFKATPDVSLTPEEVIRWVDENPTEANIADAYETAYVAFSYFDDETYDYEQYSQKWAYYAWNSDQWYLVVEHTRDMILDILRSENAAGAANHIIEGIGYHFAIQPFMERNGYYEGSGWWIPQKDANGNSLALRSLQMRSCKI